MSQVERTRKHALKRLRERYNICLSDGEYEELCMELAAQDDRGGLPTVSRNFRNRSRPLVNFRIRGVQVRAVYDRATFLIVTFLPFTPTGGATVERGERAWKRQQERHAKRYTRRTKYRGAWE